jgi:hypothetical protein
MSIKENAITFLESLGFTDVRPIQGDAVRMMVRGALRVMRKKLRASNMKFVQIEATTLPNSRVHKYFVVQNRQIIGELHLEHFSVHAIIELKKV